MTTRRLSIYPNSQSFEDNLFELQRNFSALAKNLRELEGINRSLLTFNKNFAVFLQGLRLNSECLEFPEAPNAQTYALAERPVTPPTPQLLPRTGDAAMSPSDAMGHEAPAPKQQQQQPPKKRVVIKTGGRRRKPVFQTWRITDLLPPRFRDQPHKNTIEQILKELNLNRDGMYAHEIIRDVGYGLTRSRCMDYMNALVHTEAVKRVNKKGHLFYLDPEQFPQ
ncbi:DASH complex subunit dam1 [Coemansia nantahalensis]|uniref:DASH complex subunit dam1 n=1 Tax=Coemansia nantahalensis TaxID=2789366 RepID=A0ACC1K0F6_9FUNG|nr:DASH complex subunit dam1 [Coemansia nantahalensis]KAJ2771243.1 DASH complex subunit dam1 [Coemansia nantahalensis]